MAVVNSAAGISYPNNQATDSPSIVTAASAMVYDLDPIVKPHFASIGAADTALSAIKNGTGAYSGDARVGMLITVGTPPVLYMWNGTSWLPDAARRVSYDGSKTFSGVAPGSDVTLGLFPDQNGFLGHSSGVTVPEDGVYDITLVIFISPGALGRTFVSVSAASGIAQVYVPNTATSWPFNEQRATVSYNGATIAAGGVIGVTFGHNNAGAATVTARMTVVKVRS